MEPTLTYIVCFIHAGNKMEVYSCLKDTCPSHTTFSTGEHLGGMGGVICSFTQSMMDDFIQVQRSSSINPMCTPDTNMTFGGCLQGGGHVDITLIMTVQDCPCDWVSHVRRQEAVCLIIILFSNTCY